MTKPTLIIVIVILIIKNMAKNTSSHVISQLAQTPSQTRAAVLRAA